MSVIVDDIQRKNGNGADPAVVNAACRASGSTIEWLADARRVLSVLVTGFTYPGKQAIGAVKSAPSVDTLALACGLPREALALAIADSLHIAAR